MFQFWIDLTLWLLGMNFSSEHTQWKKLERHPLLGYDIQTHGVWPANDLGSEKGSTHVSHIGHCFDPKPNNRI